MNRIRYNEDTCRVELSTSCQKISIDYNTFMQLAEKLKHKDEMTSKYERMICFHDPLEGSQRYDVALSVKDVSTHLIMESFDTEEKALEYAKELTELINSKQSDYLVVQRDGIYAVRKDRIKSIKVV